MHVSKRAPAASPHRPAAVDRVTLYALIATGLAIGIERAIRLWNRVASITGPGPHRAPVTPRNLETVVQLGSGGGTQAEITTGTLKVAELSGPETGLLITQEVVTFLAIATIIVCLTLLARNTIRGTVFHRSNTALLTGAGLAAAAGYGAWTFFGQMASNEIISRLSVARPAVYGTSGDFMPYFLGLFAFGIVTVAYAVGARLQRETEGLV
ncbi:hypothetical protein ACFSWE_02005 [Leucobacter albus]|uniref:DUF2975 family protein n=1 Tax=Leucobacter albus TaxID=272210 RepID=A0ABW3TNA5_9MICO